MSTTWKERAIERANGVADAWDVTRAWLAQFAQWILFLCMIANILEVLVSLPPLFVDTVLGVQAVTLDVAGFGLTSMADHARRQGDQEAAQLASWTGWTLIAIMMTTIGGVTVGILWPDYKPTTDLLEKVLILVRVAMTVFYGHVIHQLRDAAEASRAAQVHTSIASEVHAQVQQVQATLRQEVHATVQVVHQQVQRSLATEVHAMVQRSLSEQGEQVQMEVQTTLKEWVQQTIEQTTRQLVARMDEARAQVEDAVGQQVHAALAEQASVVPTAPVLRLVDPVQEVQAVHEGVQVSERSEQVQGDVQSTVTRYLGTQLSQGHTPTIAEIMAACGCSKGTAIKYRKHVLAATADHESA